MTTEISTAAKANSKEALEILTKEIEGFIAPMGYEVVALELTTAGSRILRLSIDFLSNTTLDLIADPEAKPRRISLDDCVAVNDAVDELLETTPLIDGAYNLEVSSPGVERPLRKASDYTRFRGHKARVGTYRPLTAEELTNSPYWEKNKKQKNFIGHLIGLTADGAAINMKPDAYKAQAGTPSEITIPLALVSKAHLEYVELEEESV